ncbi:hypothetical protein EUTSA_v10027506mg, partial [Eutrema salsugineum]
HVHYYPTISLVSKSFRSLVASPELYTRRSLLGCTEHCLYVVLSNRLYEFRRKANSKNPRLVAVGSLPLMPCHASYVAEGSKIYVVGGLYDQDIKLIDCISHTVQTISRIPNLMSEEVASIIGGKIYIIGNCLCDDMVSWSGRVLVFDTVTQMWEPVMTKPDSVSGLMFDDVVMEDKIYLTNIESSFVYRPKENKWKLDKKLDSKVWEGACVVDDVLYYYDVHHKGKLRAYDPKQRRWRIVKGLEDLNGYYGGKLALFYPKERKEPCRKRTGNIKWAWETTVELWCAEIALERHQGGEIWGKVQWCDVVIDDEKFSSENYVKCLAVTI